MNGKLAWIINFFLIANHMQSQSLPDTQISGVYEVIVGVENIDDAIRYFEEFGFSVVDSIEISGNEVERIYGISHDLRSYRMQNGDIDSHGLIRLMEWKGNDCKGVGYAPPETIGQRMAVMRTEDIYRLYDTYEAARSAGNKWLSTPPVSDDLFDLDQGEKSFFNRPVSVRENAVYGDFFNHVFFQRYGYQIPGYGTIHDNSILRTSEFTHHDFIIHLESMDQMSYLSSALGLQAEEEPVLDGDWQKGPKAVFMMDDGESHWYQGFVSPNNICGKLKFFIPTSVKTDRSHLQKVGCLGITLHSFYTPKLEYVYELVKAHNLSPSSIQENEYKERSFIFTGPEGANWQIIEKSNIQNEPKTELKFELVKG